jgi:hypothetical protein
MRARGVASNPGTGETFYLSAASELAVKHKLAASDGLTLR